MWCCPGAPQETHDSLAFSCAIATDLKLSGPGDLSDRELLVLGAIPKATDIGALGRLTKLPPAALGEEIATLQIKGYIAVDGTLTQKGLDAVRESY